MSNIMHHQGSEVYIIKEVKHQEIENQQHEQQSNQRYV